MTFTAILPDSGWLKGFLAHGRIEGEATDDEHVEADPLDRFLGRLLDEQRAHGPMLRSDADGRPLRRAVRLGVGAGAVNPLAGIDVERIELQPLLLARVLHAG